jgi:hypothetical protein
MLGGAVKVKIFGVRWRERANLHLAPNEVPLSLGLNHLCKRPQFNRQTPYCLGSASLRGGRHRKTACNLHTYRDNGT